MRILSLHSDASHADLYLISCRVWLTPIEILERAAYRDSEMEEIWKAFRMKV